MKKTHEPNDFTPVAELDPNDPLMGGTDLTPDEHIEVLRNHAKDLEEENRKLKAANARLKAKNAPASTPATKKRKQLARVLAAGTKLGFGGITVELAGDAEFVFDRADDEQFVAALCRLSDNYDANAPLFKCSYDGNGNPIT